MKTFRRIILSVVVLVCGFVAGYCTGQENGKNIILSQYKLLHNDYDAKTELVKAQEAALDAADHVMGKNELFNTDRSDEMVDRSDEMVDRSDEMVKYLDLAHKVDSLYQLEE